jgi:DNA-binding LacI/PurR family transcriptional regulator
MKAKATLKQIAKELHVSVSTVSKALNDSPEISEQTKQKVQEYAKLKNYKPNIIGLNLKNRKTKTIGVIIPNILNSFFAKVFTGIEKVADSRGYNVITCISNESLEKEAHTLEMLSNGTIDGFILSISEEAQKQQEKVAKIIVISGKISSLDFGQSSKTFVEKYEKALTEGKSVADAIKIASNGKFTEKELRECE